jgi:hypothetical protein
MMVFTWEVHFAMHLTVDEMMVAAGDAWTDGMESEGMGSAEGTFDMTAGMDSPPWASETGGSTSTKLYLQ